VVLCCALLTSALLCSATNPLPPPPNFQTLAPKYEKLASAFAGEADVVIGKVDATQHPTLAARYDVGGYPTLKFFPAGASEPEAYEEARELEAMVGFVNKKTGTMRLPDGGLMPTAGRVEALDGVIKGAGYKVDAVLVEALKIAIELLTGSELVKAAAYVTAAEKILAKGDAYLLKEITRLQGMITGSSVVPEKKTAFQLRKNVLAAFIMQ
jgi:protein disulfide-isomerase A6